MDEAGLRVGASRMKKFRAVRWRIRRESREPTGAVRETGRRASVNGRAKRSREEVDGETERNRDQLDRKEMERKWLTGRETARFLVLESSFFGETKDYLLVLLLSREGGRTCRHPRYRPASDTEPTIIMRRSRLTSLLR